MADIPIERKANRNIWPIVIGIIVVLAILWWVFARRHDQAATGNTTADTVMTTPATTPPANPPANPPATTAPANP
jgi:hypothetical protein